MASVFSYLRFHFHVGSTGSFRPAEEYSLLRWMQPVPSINRVPVVFQFEGNWSVSSVLQAEQQCNQTSGLLTVHLHAEERLSLRRIICRRFQNCVLDAGWLLAIHDNIWHFITSRNIIVHQIKAHSIYEIYIYIYMYVYP